MRIVFKTSNMFTTSCMSLLRAFCVLIRVNLRMSSARILCQCVSCILATQTGLINRAMLDTNPYTTFIRTLLHKLACLGLDIKICRHIHIVSALEKTSRDFVAHILYHSRGYSGRCALVLPGKLHRHTGTPPGQGQQPSSRFCPKDSQTPPQLAMQRATLATLRRHPLRWVAARRMSPQAPAALWTATKSASYRR